MKAEVEQDSDSWVNIVLTSETAKETAQLVRLGMNMGASNHKTPARASIWVNDDSVKLYVTVAPTMSRRRKENQRTQVRFQP